MHFQIVGINHKSAPIGIREKVSFSAKELGSALRQLAASEAIAVTVSSFIVSPVTCIKVFNPRLSFYAASIRLRMTISRSTSIAYMIPMP